MTINLTDIKKYVNFITSGYDNEKKKFWEMRGIKSGETVFSRFFGNKDDVIKFFENELPEKNWYLGVMPRNNNGGGTANDIEEGNILYVEFDTEDVGIEATDDLAREIYKILGELGIRPSLVGNSGHGVHTYWKIKNVVERKVWENLENNIIKFVKSKLEKFNPDTGCKDWARILRILGTANIKTTPVESSIVIEDYSEYSVDFLKKYLPIMVDKKDIEKNVITRPEYKTSTIPCDALSKIMEGVDKGRRHSGQFAIAVFGWNNGWSYDDVKEASLEFNKKCSPPKSEVEVISNLDANWRSFERGNVKDLGCKSDGLFSTLLNQFCPYKENKDECEWMYPTGNKISKEERESKTTEMINKVVETLKDNYYFRTAKDNDMIYVYKDGIYKSEGEIIIAQETMKVLGKHTKINIVNESKAHIKYSTYIDRKIFDNDPNIICLGNGIFNLMTKELNEHSPGVMITSQLPITYDPKLDCPKIKQFLSEILYPDDIPFVQEYFGFALYRIYFIRKVMLMFGEGGNGKSTLIELFERFIGGEDRKNISHVSLNKLAYDRFAGADMYNKYLNIFDELEQDAITNTSLFKQATGGSTIRAEFKGKNAFDYMPFGKHIFSCNQIPDVKDNTDAFFERLAIITFPYKFVASPDPNNLNEKKARLRDEIMKEITRDEEMSGLFNWALEGLYRLIKNKEFTGTKSMEETRKEFMLKSTPINAFIESEIELDTESELEKKNVYGRYIEFCKKNKLSECGYQVFCQKFFEKLADHIQLSRPQSGDKRIMVWKGIKYKEKKVEQISLDGEILDEDIEL